eukprot:759785_1
MESIAVNQIAIPLIQAWSLTSVGYILFMFGNALSNMILTSIWSDSGSIRSKGLAMQLTLITLSGCYTIMAFTNNVLLLRLLMQFTIGVNVLANIQTLVRAHMYDYGWLLSNIGSTIAHGMIYSTM